MAQVARYSRQARLPYLKLCRKLNHREWNTLRETRVGVVWCARWQHAETRGIREHFAYMQLLIPGRRSRLVAILSYRFPVVENIFVL